MRAFFRDFRSDLLSGLMLFLMAGISVNIHGQTAPVLFTKGLSIKFDATELKKLEKAENLLNEAEMVLQEANQMYSKLTEEELNQRYSQAYRNSLKKLLESSEMFKEANGQAYAVFLEKSAAFWEKHSRSKQYASGMDKARYYESSATRTMNRSLIRRKQALESDRFEYSLEIMNDSKELEALAIRDQGRALQICLDFPVEYDYKWDDDPSLEEIVKILKDPIVHEPPSDIFATVDVKVPVDSSLLKEIIFKVQIAAHTKTLTDEYLNLLYKGNIPIDMIFEEDWYKYSIGRYKTFEEAEATRIECNIKKAFVVAYSEGKKINIKEALDILEKRKSANL